jgi:putative transposase
MGKKQEGPFREEQIDEWLKNGHKPEDVKSLLQQITKAVLERALQGELTEHLGYAKGDVVEKKTDNARNGSTSKSLRGEFGEIELETPRDRKGEFEPQLIKKHQTRFTGFDEKVLWLYARGLTTREIQGHLEEMYGVEVSPALISDITDGVMEQAKAWQNRPLEAFYPVVFLDALFVKMRHEGRVENRAVFVALGINLEGQKEVLGLWTGAAEGARFWLGVLTELRNRGVKDIYVVCVDGLRGFPQAIEAVFPKAQVQLCIVHLVRNSLNYVTWKDLRRAATDLKPIYRSATAAQAELELLEFEKRWAKYPAIGKLWSEHWERVIPFFAMPAELRKVVYTTNAVESLHRNLRKTIKTRGSFPSEEAALKLLYLAIIKTAAQWHTVQNWKPALNYLETECGNRMREAFSSK